MILLLAKWPIMLSLISHASLSNRQNGKRGKHMKYKCIYVNLSIRQIYCKASHSTEVIIWCIWVLRLVKYYNLVATKCQYFSPLTVGTHLYFLHVSKLYEHKEYTEGYLWNEAQFYIYTQKNILRKPNRHKSQTRVIKGTRIKPHIIFLNNWC